MNALQKKITVTVAIAVVAGIGLAAIKFQKKESFSLTPASVNAAPAPNPLQPDTSATQVGTGWSTGENEAQITREALRMALHGKQKHPDFIFLAASSGCNIGEVLKTARQMVGNKTQIHGGTSDSQGVITNLGFAYASRKGFSVLDPDAPKAVAALTVSSQEVTFGTGASDTGNASSFPSVEKAAEDAIRQAIRNAGKSETDTPDAILLQVSIGIEEEVLTGIINVVGDNTIIQGGTTGGPQFGVIGNDSVYTEGLSVAAIYTDLPIGYTFGSSFEVMDKNVGVVTAADEVGFREINNRPALEVYNEWLGGSVQELIDKNATASTIKEYLTLHPICRKLYSKSGNVYYVFTHIWPSNDFMKNGALINYSQFKKGEKIYLCHGTWEMLMNRFEKLPTEARSRGQFRQTDKPLMGFGVICTGIMSVIPQSERDKIPVMINLANRGGPFIATFNWGEQGYFPEVGNRHANLTTSFLIIGAE